MANLLMRAWKNALMEGDANAKVSGNPIKVALVDTSAAPFSSANSVYADISAGVQGVSPALTGVALASAVLDSSNTVVTALTGSTVAAYYLFVSAAATGMAGRYLMAHVDTSVALFPYTPDGSNVTITWDTSGIFQL